jgi:DNA-binding HxlR family transcriptional regulator
MSKIADPQLRHDRVLLDLLGNKWTILVLGVLCDNDKRSRFNAIKRQIPGISQKALTQCLRRLERSGLIERRVIDAAPLAVEYEFTPLGDTLEAPVAALFSWTASHATAVRTVQLSREGLHCDPEPRMNGTALKARTATLSRISS